MRGPAWQDPRAPEFDDEIAPLYQSAVPPEPFWPDVDVTENPVTAELLGPDGAVIRQWRARPPFGFTRGSGS